MDEFFNHFDYVKPEVFTEKMSHLQGLPIVVRVVNDGDFSKWVGGLHPVTVKVAEENNHPKTIFIGDDLTYLFIIDSIIPSPNLIDPTINILQTEFNVGDEIYLRFHEQNLNSFLVCCKYEEYE